MNFRISISKEKIDSLFMVDVSKLYLWNKHDVSIMLFYLGMLIVYFGSLHPWFLWPLKELYPIPAAGLLFVSYVISNSMQKPVFSRNDYLKPWVAYIILSFYIVFVGDMNANAYITNCFTIVVFFTLFRIDITVLQKLADIIAKTMAIILIPSMFFFVLYLMGFGLPSIAVVFGDNDYSFNNYFFFMIEDSSLSVLIPRFQSVFLEPGHLGSATTILLMTQIGRWKKWWNVTLLIATVISFSLAAYAILIALIFLSLWVQRKNIIGVVIFTSAFLGAVALTATFYNDGDNLVNNLILARLEVDDKTGDIVGNNRVDENFEKEFNKFITTSDAFFGRDMSRIPKGSGNSGYRVFIYQNGLIGLLLVVVFYFLSFKGFQDSRHLITVIIISLLIFWIRGYPLWYSNFIPILATVCAPYIRKERSVEV